MSSFYNAQSIKRALYNKHILRAAVQNGAAHYRRFALVHLCKTPLLFVKAAAHVPRHIVRRGRWYDNARAARRLLSPSYCCGAAPCRVKANAALLRRFKAYAPAGQIRLRLGGFCKVRHTLAQIFCIVRAGLFYGLRGACRGLGCRGYCSTKRRIAARLRGCCGFVQVAKILRRAAALMRVYGYPQFCCQFVNGLAKAVYAVFQHIKVNNAAARIKAASAVPALQKVVTAVWLLRYAGAVLSAAAATYRADYALAPAAAVCGV